MQSSTTPVEDYLSRQRLVTPVVDISRHKTQYAPHLDSQQFSLLIPLSKPGPSEQYAFVVDMDLCSGCKACVSACHSMNGLSENESWRDVGTIVGSSSKAYAQTVTSACHHCEDPGCLNGCPVMAYEKDPVTGIVHHLDDQCIGCEYCIMKCPYEVPKYNPSMGIVRKCDMCHNRLADGEAPACVQACPTQAISIAIVEKNNPMAPHRKHKRLVPGAADSSYTLPTTRFVTKKDIPENTVASDALSLAVQPPHWPLIIMLVLTQFSVGICLFSTIYALYGFQVSGITSATATLLGLSGLAASIFHLGHPLKAWRFFMGLKTSWLSREILVFSMFGGLLPVYGLLGLFPDIPCPAVLKSGLLITLSCLGLVGVFCSAKIYEDTHRPFWSATYTFSKFFGTVLAAGLATGTESLSLAILVVFSALRLTAEFAFPLSRKIDSFPSLLCNSQKIMRTLLKEALLIRFAAGISGGILLPLAILFLEPPLLLVLSAAFALILAGELAQRYLYFRAVVPLKMPGNLSNYDTHKG